MSSISTSTTIKTPTLSKRAEKLLTVMMAVISPLLLIGLLEGLAFIWERTQANGLYAWELVASRRMVWVQYYEPGAGFTLMKPGSHYEWQSISVDINSHGLRGPETTYEKPPGVFRILNLGDSVAMGWGVGEDDTYGQQLEQLLTERGTGNLRYEVINAGVPGWSLENALAYLEAQGLKFEPDLILFDLTIANDINGKSALLADDKPALLKWLGANTYFWPFLQSQAAWAKARAQGRDRVDTIDPPTNPAKYFPLDPQADRWVERWNSVLDINRLARENNARFVLILFPLEFQVLDESYPTLPQDVFTAEAAEAGIPVLDLLPAFQQACREKTGGACQLEDRYLFADVWMHPSASGHKVTAIELEEVLAGMLP
jgi:lysophospholipase L1-like esterase